MKAPETILLHGYSFDDEPCKNWTTEPLKNGLRGHAIQYEKYISKESLMGWAKEHKRVIETHGDERDAFLRGEYSVLNSLIDKIESL